MMANKHTKKGKSWKNCTGIRKRQQNVKKAREARLAARCEYDNGNEGELVIEAPGLVQEPEGEIIFEAPKLVQEPEDGFLHPGRVMRRQKWDFATEGARGVPEVSPTKRVGQLKF